MSPEEVYMHRENTSSQIYRGITASLGFKKPMGQRLFRGYREVCQHTDRLADITHLVRKFSLYQTSWWYISEPYPLESGWFKHLYTTNLPIIFTLIKNLFLLCSPLASNKQFRQRSFEHCLEQGQAC
jgi:hypothetical protein